MRGRNLRQALGTLALGLAALALAACSEAGPQRAAAQLPELQVTITPAGCGEVAVAPVGSADTAFVYTSTSPSTWAHAADTHLEARARAKAGCSFTRWTIHWGGVTVGNTPATSTKFAFLEGMTATAHFSGTPATPTPTPLALTVTAGEGGSVTVSPAPGVDGTHPSGTTVTLTATADKGYDFSAWQGLPEGATVTAGPAAVTTTSGTETSVASFTLAAAATVTAAFRVESIPYNLHTTGTITAAGSYALLSDPDDLTSTMEWSDLGYTNPPYGLLLHVSDSTGVSRASYYGAIAVGDRVDAWWGDRCQRRLKVAEVRSDPVGTPARKLFVVEKVAFDGAGCVFGIKKVDAPQLVEFRWRQPPWRVAADGLREFWEEAVPGPGRYQLEPAGDHFGHLSIEVPANASIWAGSYYQGGWKVGLSDVASGSSLHLDDSGEEAWRSVEQGTGAAGASERDIDALFDQIIESIRMGRGQ